MILGAPLLSIALFASEIGDSARTSVHCSPFTVRASQGAEPAADSPTLRPSSTPRPQPADAQGTLAARPALSLEWTPLADLPGGLGVASPFAGISHGTMIVAGGANFPHGPPSAGGRKVWHDTVFALTQPSGTWKSIGKLPHPLAYGVSASHAHAVVCVGGSDADRHYADTFRLRLRAGELIVEPLAPLPVPLANLSGARVGNVLYVVGGTELPGERSASRRLFALDLRARSSRWRELDPLPGPARLLATAAASHDAFYVFGGATLTTNSRGEPSRTYLRDAWRYHAKDGWTRLADLPRPSVGAPTPAPFVHRRFLLLGGDDGSHAGFQPPDLHPGFDPTVLLYDVRIDRWSQAGQVPEPRVTLPCVEWKGSYIIPSGELRPGVRTPHVWRLQTRRP